MRAQVSEMPRMAAIEAGSAFLKMCIRDRYYLDNEEALTKERRDCASRYKNLNGRRGEFTEEKTKYVDFRVKNEALTNDINALTKEKDELEVKNLSLIHI